MTLSPFAHLLIALGCLSVLLPGCSSPLPSDVSGPYVLDGADRFVSLPQPQMGERFTYTFWASPVEADEVDSVAFTYENLGYFNQHFVLFPEHGGEKAAGTGVSLGTNYVGVYEHRSNFFNARISHPADLKGWHHYAVAYDQNALQLFIDGEKAGSAPALGPVVKPHFSLGKVFGGNLPFKGQVDELALWEKSLTASEIKALMAGKLKGDEAGLTYYYDFDDLSTLPGIMDKSGHERHATEQGYTHSTPLDTARATGAGFSKRVEVDMTSAYEAMSYAVDRLTENSLEIELAGWAFIPGKDALAQQTYIILRGRKDYFFTTEQVKRNDLTQQYENNLDDCGFQARIRKADLEPDQYQVWLYIVKQDYFRHYHPTQYKVTVK